MEKFKSLISNIWNILQIEGFSKKGNTFYINKNGNWGILDFQSSRKSTFNEVLFTINLGVSLTKLRKFNGDDLKQKPEVEKSHWSKRVGFLLPENKDYWWKINDDVVLNQLTDEILSILKNVAIPQISKFLQEENSEKEWLSGVSYGLTELQRYVYLTTLLKLNNDERLQLYVEKLKRFASGKPFEEVVDDHIMAIG